MNNLNDKDFQDLFGSLSEGEATVSSDSWGAIAENLTGQPYMPGAEKALAKGFLKFSWSGLNIFTVAGGIMLATAVVFTGIKMKTSENAAAETSSRIESLEQGVAGEKLIIASGDSGYQSLESQENINRPINSLPESSLSEPGKKVERPAAGDGGIKTVSSAGVLQTPQTASADNITNAANGKAEADHKPLDNISNVPGNTVNAVSPAEKPAVAKKIIVFEEDTVIKVDTIVTKKKVRKGSNQ